MSLVLFKKNNNIATITLNSPKQLNALSIETAKEFKKTILKIKKDQSIKVVIITGAGRAFSSGGNLDMITKKFKTGFLKNKMDLKKFYNMFFTIRELSQPVIAAINGPAVGAGLCLALACDLKYASPQAKLGFSFAKMGLSPGMGTTYFITKLAGPVVASEILFMAKTLTANNALKHGLINDIFDTDTLIPKVTQIANDIAKNSPLVLNFIKKGIYKSLDSSFDQILNFDSKAQAKSFATKDVREGFAAIKEKRAPQFLGE